MDPTDPSLTLSSGPILIADDLKARALALEDLLVLLGHLDEALRTPLGDRHPLVQHLDRVTCRVAWIALQYPISERYRSLALLRNQVGAVRLRQWRHHSTLISDSPSDDPPRDLVCGH